MATASPRPFDMAATQRRVRHPLQALRGSIRFYVALEGALTALLYLSIWFWVGLLLDYGSFLAFSFDWVQELQEAAPGARPDFWVRLLLLVLLVLGLIALVTFKIVLRLGREFNDRALALVLERRFPRQLGDRLITAVELAEPRRLEKYGYSVPLIEKTIAEAAERVESCPVREVFNWGRLWMLGLWAFLASVGTYLLVMLATCVWWMASPPPVQQVRNLEDVGAVLEQRSSGPGDFFFRFNDVAAIWAERNLLLRDVYWPRQAFLDVLRFVDTPSHPGEMRVGRDEQRPELLVRAYRWVVADRSAFGGWRPLRWEDLQGGLLARHISQETLTAANLPLDWTGWKVDLDDLPANTPVGLVPPTWNAKPCVEVRAEFERLQPMLRVAAMDQAVGSLFDWRTWSIDKIEDQVFEPQNRRQLRGDDKLRPQYKAMEDVFGKLEELAAAASMSRTLRKLTIPDLVEVVYRGQTTKSVSSHERMAGNRYAIGLNDLKESVRFYARGADYVTPTRRITLVPPPTIQSLELEKDEPAYLYWRLQGDQQGLKGRKQRFVQTVSVTGDQSTILVPFGSDLKLTAKAERKLKPGVRAIKPQRNEERGALVPDPAVNPVVAAPDGLHFSIAFRNVVLPYEFEFAFQDEDNVKGKRRILIRPVDDRKPEIFDLEMLAALRKPRFKADPNRPQAAAPDGFLVTPNALLPFKGTVRDDHGLTKVSWLFEAEPVDLELIGGVGLPGKSALPILEFGGNTRQFRLALIASGFQVLPGPAHAAAVSAPLQWGLVEKVLTADLARPGLRGAGEQRQAMAGFQRRMEQRSVDEVPLAALAEKLASGQVPARGLLRDHDLKEENGFDVNAFLPDIKSPDASKQAQLHYLLKVSVEAVDNNIETGPTANRNQSPFVFLVVSENELLAQIALEEEVLRERLEKAYQKLRNGKVALDEQNQKLAGAGDLEYALVSIRVDEVRKALLDAASAGREVYTDYGRILRELEVNNVRRDKVEPTREKIYFPLEELVFPGTGNFAVTEELLNRLYQGLEDDISGKRGLANRAAHLKVGQDGSVQLERLMSRLNDILLAMDEGISLAKLLDLIVNVERDQRSANAILTQWRNQRIEQLLNELTQPNKK